MMVQKSLTKANNLIGEGCCWFPLYGNPSGVKTIARNQTADMAHRNDMTVFILPHKYIKLT